jgi:hypothetical protein
MSVCTVDAFCYRPQDYERYVWKETTTPCGELSKTKSVRASHGKYFASTSIRKGEVLNLDPIDDVVRDYGQKLQEDAKQRLDFSTFYETYTSLENVKKNVNVRMVACPDGPVYEARRDISPSEELLRYATPAYWIHAYAQEGVEEAKNKLESEKRIAPEGYLSTMPDDDVTVETMESSSLVDAWRKAKSSTTTMTLTVVFGAVVVLVVVGLVLYFFGNKILSVVTAVLGYAVVLYLQYLASDSA